jgi:putative phage-type endonuclease
MITDRQREQRRKSIGSSDAAVVLGLSKYRSRYDLWLEKTGRTEGFQGNESTERGEFLEDGILKWAAKRLGRKVVKPSNSFTYTTQGGCVLRAHVDGQADKYGRTYPIVEAKNMVYGDGWGKDGSEEIPVDVYVQVQHQMLCAESNEAWVARLDGRGFSLHPVDPDPEIQRAIIEQSEAFWNAYVLTDTPPPFTEANESMIQYMQRAYTTDGTETKIDDDHLRMYNHWKITEEDAKERKLFHKAKIMEQMGDAKKGLGEDFRCTMGRGGGGNRLDQSMLKQQFPDVYEACTVPSSTYHYPKITEIKKGDDK